MPASRMSLRARLTSRTSVVVSDLRPAFFFSFDVFQMHAITDTLLATDTSTQIDSIAMYNLSVTEMDEDDISQLLTQLLKLLMLMLR